jgi:hypothetical protein
MTPVIPDTVVRNETGPLFTISFAEDGTVDIPAGYEESMKNTCQWCQWEYVKIARRAQGITAVQGQLMPH